MIQENTFPPPMTAAADHLEPGRSFRSRFSAVHLLVAAIAGVSLFLGLSNIKQQGFANYYYAAAVRSMMQNWHAFYFVSLDPKGFVSIDKPPVGFWIQTGSALLFGYHGWSILLPQAIAAALSTVVLYSIVRRFFGPIAGLIAALALAISPLNVAVARNNTPDGLLVFALLLASLCLAKSIQSGRALWLIGAFALVGVGFNIKMMEAYLVLPGMAIAYLCSAHSSFRRRIGHLAAASVALVVVSFSWATTVWLTPANQRPYVGSTKDNNIFSLIFGYNGINRLLPKGWSILGIGSGVVAMSSVSLRGSGPASGRLSENGPQSLFRLLNHQIGGQVGWLIPLALIGLLVAWGRPRWRKIDSRQTMLLMFGTWGVVEVIFFSEAGFFHRYYLSTLSPALSALSGIGVVALWRLFRSSTWTALILPATLAGTAAVQFRILAIYPFWQSRIEPALIAAIVVSVVAFVVNWLLRCSTRLRSGLAPATIGLVALASLLVVFAAPAVWSYTTIDRGYNGALPIAGPDAEATSSHTLHSPLSDQTASIDAVVRAELKPRPLSATKPVVTDSGQVIMNFLDAHRGRDVYVVAVLSSREADPIIVNTGESVMTLGGFSGADPIVTIASIKRMIKANDVRFFLFQGGDQPLASSLQELASIPGESENAWHRSTEHETAAAWVEQSCKLVPPATIAASTPNAATSGLNGLYDCKGKGN